MVISIVIMAQNDNAHFQMHFALKYNFFAYF